MATTRSFPALDLGIWWRWVVANTVGELLGFGLGFAAGALLALLVSESLGTILLAAAVAGGIEGAIVGVAQWTVVRRRLVTIAGRWWVGATVAGAVVAWCVGMVVGSMAGDALAAGPPPSPLLLLAISGALGAVAGLILAAPQWLLLRREVANAWVWAPAQALAWAVGLILAFVGIDLASAASSPVAFGVGIGVSGLAMGAAAAAMSGLAAAWLLRGQPATSSRTRGSTSPASRSIPTR